VTVATTAVDGDTVAAFQRDGAVCVRRVADDTEVALLRDGVDRNLADPSPRFLDASAEGDAGRFVEDFCNWDRIPEYTRFIGGSRAPAIAAALMGADTVRLFHDHVLVKEPGTATPTPWHQDQPYYNVDGQQTCSMWLVLDPVSEASSLTFVAGSHLGPWLLPRTFKDAQARWFPEGSLADLPDIDADLARDPDSHRLLRWALEPGDAVFFSMLTLHSAGGVEGPNRRRAFSLRFLGDDVTHAPRPWRTSPDFPGLADDVPAGAPMDHPRFPVVWDHGRPGRLQI